MSFTLYGIKFTHTSARSAAQKIFGAMSEKSEAAAVFTPNLHIALAAKNNKNLRALLKKGDIILPDGLGISLLRRAQGKSGTPRITGIDMGYVALQYAERHGLRVFLLGGKEGVCERAARRLKKQLPRLRICGVHNGYFDMARTSEQNRALLKKIRGAHPALLLVCMGFPRQEHWICQSRHALPSVRLFMALGGALDVWSGDVSRAPLAWRVLGLEWLWRCFL